MQDSTITKETAANKRKKNYDDNKVTLFVPVSYSKQYVDKVCIKKTKVFGVFEDIDDGSYAVLNYTGGEFDLIDGISFITLVVDKREIDHLYTFVVLLKTNGLPSIFTYIATKRGEIKNIKKHTEDLVKSATNDIEDLLYHQVKDKIRGTVFEHIKLELHRPEYHITGQSFHVTRSKSESVPKSSEEEYIPKSSEGEFIPGSPEEESEPKLKKRKVDLE